MKKLITLLTLALLSIGSAWAATVDDLKSITTATTIVMDGVNGSAALETQTLYSNDQLLCIGGNGYSSSKGSTTYNEVTYKNVYQIKNSRQIALKIGFNAIVTIVGNSNSGRSWRIGTSSAGDEVASSDNGADHLTGNVDGSSKAKVIYINASGDLYLGAIIIEGNASPTINASAATVFASESGVEATQDIAVTGTYLNGSTLTATLNPAVDGLSVTLGSSTITAGAISTTATLHYTSTTNAKGSTTLTLSDGTTSKSVTVNYKALVVPSELVAISRSEATTFDLKNTGVGLENVTPDNYVVLTDAGSEASFADNLAVKGVGTLNVAWRNDAIQAGFFKFKTTVPGTVTLKFSDTGGTAGGDRAPRYANVNGTRSDVSSNGSSGTGAQVTCSPIEVSAGEVIIKGEQFNSSNDTYTDNQIRLFTITFTPATTYVDVSDKLYRTFASSSDLDFSIVDDGLTAYRAVVDGDNVSFVEVTGKVPAGEGLLVKATAAGRYYIAKSMTEPDAIDNALVGVTNSTTTVGAGSFVLYDGTNGVGFYKTSAAEFTLSPNTAYLPANVASRSFIALDGETTGVSAMLINNQETIKNGEVYNLSGQRVAQPTKGLYIVNGKKVSIK